LVFTAAASAGKGPYLELDTKGHMALIRSIVFTSDGSQLISASDDKTIRVWDVATGRIVRTIRGEIGDGDPGKIYALALSRDGRLLAAGGRTGATAFSLKLPAKDSPLGEPKALRAGADEFARAVTETGGLSLQTRASGEFGYLDLLDVVKDGKLLATIERGENAGYAHNAFTFTHDGKTVISGGGHGFLTAPNQDALISSSPRSTDSGLCAPGKADPTNGKCEPGDNREHERDREDPNHGPRTLRRLTGFRGIKLTRVLSGCA
jgi:WD40 repeat protein